jgi:RNA polymerase sigma-70 factor, ECF subfamily
MNDVNPLHLIRRCEAGETGAIEEFVNTYQLDSYRLALSILDDPAEAEEAAQDALVTALGKLSSFRGEAAFTTWLYALTLNLCRMRLRKRRSRQRLANVLKDNYYIRTQTHNPEAELQRIESDAVLWSAMRRLTDQEREAIVLRYYHDLPITNISQVTGVSERTVHKRLQSAHERLRILLEERE